MSWLALAQQREPVTKSIQRVPQINKHHVNMFQIAKCSIETSFCTTLWNRLPLKAPLSWLALAQQREPVTKSIQRVPQINKHHVNMFQIAKCYIETFFCITLWNWLPLKAPMSWLALAKQSQPVTKSIQGYRNEETPCFANCKVLY